MIRFYRLKSSISIKPWNTKVLTNYYSYRVYLTLLITDAGVKVTATKAGHVLGACMFNIEIDGVRYEYFESYNLIQVSY